MVEFECVPVVGVADEVCIDCVAERLQQVPLRDLSNFLECHLVKPSTNHCGRRQRDDNVLVQAPDALLKETRYGQRKLIRNPQFEAILESPLPAELEGSPR